MQQEAQPGRVWIVGAGFSRPLGGPLLLDLLSAKSKSQIARRYGDPGKRLLDSACAKVVYWLFDRSSNSPSVVPSLPTMRRDVEYWNDLKQIPPFNMHRHWSDAEEFLVWLDDAANANGTETQEFQDAMMGAATQLQDVDISKPKLERPRRAMSPYETAGQIDPYGHIGSRLANYAFTGDDDDDDEEVPINEPANKHAWWCKITAEDAWQVAKLILAAETSMFIDENTLGTAERWAPYLSWTAKLTANDTIISFNYDCAIESIVEHFHRSGFPIRFGAPSSEGWLQTCKGMPTLLKLHGSACWQLVNCSVKDASTYADVLAAYDGSDTTNALIAAPGSSKVSLATSHLSFLWEAAMQAIRQATTVNVIGYRFPESDNLPKAKLLEALGDAAALRRVNLVLGRNSTDTQSVAALLQGAVGPNVQVTAKQLGSSDFLCTPKDWGE